MYRMKVSSSAIKEIGYHPEKQILEVLYSNDYAYQYINVSFEDYEELMASDSIGKHFLAMKDSYKFSRIQ